MSSGFVSRAEAGGGSFANDRISSFSWGFASAAASRMVKWLG